MSEKFEVGQDVVVTIFGKSRAGKVTDIAVRGSYDPMTLYRIDGDGWYRESNLKPLETKYKVGDLVRVRVPDWGLGSGETDLTDFVEDIKFSSEGTPTYIVRGRGYGEGWVTAVELEPVGDNAAGVKGLTSRVEKLEEKVYGVPKVKHKFKVGDVLRCPWEIADIQYTVKELSTTDDNSVRLNDYTFWTYVGGYKLVPKVKSELWYLKPAEKINLGDVITFAGMEGVVESVSYMNYKTDICIIGRTNENGAKAFRVSNRAEKIKVKKNG